MIKSKDEYITIHWSKNICDATFQPADWSIMNIPHSAKDATKVSKMLYNSATSKHICLALNRQKKNKKIETLANLNVFLNQCEWQFLDNVTILYEKPSSSSSTGFLSLSEPGYLFYKGLSPDVTKTQWFSDQYANATNFWDVAAREKESLGKNTYFKQFSWELGLLLYSLCGMHEYRSFLYLDSFNAAELLSIHAFCREHQMKGQLHVSSIEKAKKAIEEINNRCD